MAKKKPNSSTVVEKTVENKAGWAVTAPPTRAATEAPPIDAPALWQAACERISARISPRYYNLWFANVKVLPADDGAVVLGARDQFQRDWLHDNYAGFLDGVLAEIAARPVTLRFEIAPPPAEPEPEPAPAPRETVATDTTEAPGYTLKLRPEFVFERFIVGGSNQFAFAAARAVADNPALKYNPLVLFGGVGLGKTHLAQAVAHEILRARPRARVTYCSAEQFMNDYVNATRFGRMEEFRRRYRRDTDVLIIDDIQSMAGKEMTQEEFFHTFNALYEARKQIVITSDRFPQEIANLEERLKSRFQWGLIADVQPPELETRIAILKEKARLSEVELADDVAMFIAAHVHTNVRDLEGALTTLMARASLLNEGLTLKLAADVLRPMSFGEARRHSFDSIMHEVALYFGVKVQDLVAERRHRSVAEPRQVAMWFCRSHLKASYPEIGRNFGGRDHSTVITACRKVEGRLQADPTFRARIDAIRKSMA